MSVSLFSRAIGVPGHSLGVQGLLGERFHRGTTLRTLSAPSLCFGIHGNWAGHSADFIRRCLVIALEVFKLGPTYHSAL